jgi:hypothetical protein
MLAMAGSIAATERPARLMVHPSLCYSPEDNRVMVPDGVKGRELTEEIVQTFEQPDR